MAVGACVRKVCLSHSRLSLVPAAAARSCHKRVEREVLRDTGRHGCVLRMAGTPSYLCAKTAHLACSTPDPGFGVLQRLQCGHLYSWLPSLSPFLSTWGCIRNQALIMVFFLSMRFSSGCQSCCPDSSKYPAGLWRHAQGPTVDEVEFEVFKLLNSMLDEVLCVQEEPESLCPAT